MLSKEKTITKLKQVLAQCPIVRQPTLALVQTNY